MNSSQPFPATGYRLPGIWARGHRLRAAGHPGRRASAPVVLLFALLACKPGPTTSAVVGQPENLTYAPELKVDLKDMEKRPSGLYVKDLVVGTGAEATAGQVAQVHYSGWLADGRPFDSSVGGEPFEFSIGGGRVIAGWDEGVRGMKVGGKRRLVLPPHLGYGDAGAGGVIPPGATLVFDVELLALK